MTLNNATKEQYIKKQGSYSTRISARGYSDLGYDLSSIDFLPLREKRGALIAILNRAKATRKTDKNSVKIIKMVNIELQKINILVKSYNELSEARVEHKMNKACAFMYTARKFISQDVYDKIMKKALSDYGFNNTSDKTI